VTFPRHRRRQFRVEYMPPVTPAQAGNTPCIRLDYDPPLWDAVPFGRRCSRGRRIRWSPAVSRPHKVTKVVLCVGIGGDVCGGVCDCEQLCAHEDGSCERTHAMLRRVFREGRGRRRERRHAHARTQMGTWGGKTGKKYIFSMI
jgi:hypothetical protein